MMWGAISQVEVGPLVRVQGKIDGQGYLDLFRYRLRRTYPGLYNNNLIFQDDNANAHIFKVVNEWFGKYGIKRLGWPSKSPDFNSDKIPNSRPNF